MRRLLPILLLSMTVVSPAIRADSIITYTATEQFTKQTSTEENILWSFTGPQTFTLFDTLTPASADRLDPFQKPGEWFFLASTIEQGASPVGIAGLTFGTYGS